MKISNFLKTHFFSIVLTFVDDFTLNSDNNKEIWSFGLCWPSMAFLAFVALDDFLKQKLAFFDKNQAELTCFQQSDVKTNYQTRSGILKHCVMSIWNPYCRALKRNPHLKLSQPWTFQSSNALCSWLSLAFCKSSPSLKRKSQDSHDSKKSKCSKSLQ